jgi:hypothetical protein
MSRVDEVSLCEVIEENGQKFLRRLADVKDNRLIKFQLDKDRPRTFENRDILNLQDGPNHEGNIGVWHWTATPWSTNYSRDIVKTQYLEEILPVEVIVLLYATRIDELIITIRNGLPRTFSGIDAIYCIKMNNQKYTGVLCSSKDFEVSGNFWTVKDTVLSLPYYEINEEDILQVGEHQFLRSLRSPNSHKILLIKSRMEIAKQIVMARSSWKEMEKAGFTRDECQRLQAYIKGLPGQTMSREIAAKGGFPIDEAERLIREFMIHINTYLDEDDIDSAVMEALITNHDGVKQRFAGIIEERWRHAHTDKIEQSEKKKPIPEYFVSGMSLEEVIDEDQAEDLEDCSIILADQLSEAGVKEDYHAGLAAFLVSAWECRMPVLLAGPNASDIADAFSATLDGKTSDRIICSGAYSPFSVDKKTGTSRIITVENILHGDWVDHIHAIMKLSDSEYFFTNPFAEDLFVEPHGLYNYMMPIFTELFTDSMPRRNFVSEVLMHEYRHPIPKKIVKRNYIPFLTEIGGSPYYIARIQEILGIMRTLPGYKSDWDYYFILFPYAAVTGHQDALVKEMEQDSSVTKGCQNIIHQFLEGC